MRSWTRWSKLLLLDDELLDINTLWIGAPSKLEYSSAVNHTTVALDTKVLYFLLPYSANIRPKLAIHIQWTAVFPSTTDPAPCPLELFPLLVLVSNALPGIREKVFAEAFKASWDRRSLFNASQEGLELFAGILLVTSIGRSKIVYMFVPLSLKFCRIEI